MKGLYRWLLVCAILLGAALFLPPARAEPANQPGSVEIIPSTSPLVGHRTRVALNTDEPANITLNFVNADVKDVAKTVLGDYLKLNYEIAGGVEGTVTIQTSQPLTRTQVLPVLEQALRLNDMALVVSDGVYRIVPLANASKQPGIVQSHAGAAGYGIEVVPIHYVSAAQMEKLLAPLAPTQAIVHVDSTHNVLIIEGTAEERQTIIDDAAMFDTDTMQGMSFALLEPNYTDAEELTKELNQVLGGLNGTSSAIRLVPITRLNAILAISPQVSSLDRLKSWMTRLDKPGQGSDRRIFVYHVQNGRAQDLATTLAKTLLGSQSQTQVSGPEQPAPAMGAPVGPAEAYTPPGSETQGPSPPPAGPQSATGSVNAMPGVNITADTVNNALVILATPQQFATIRMALTELDITPLQVFLEAAVAEITLTNDLNLGVQFTASDAHNTAVLTDNPASTSILPTVPGFSYIYTNGASIQVILSAIATKTHVEVVSSPKILVLNNQPATIEVGDKVPIVTQSAVSPAVSAGTAPIVNSVEYEDTGVILKVVPRVNAGGLVLMDISQEVSDVTSTTSSSIDSPTIEERKINSSVAIQDGETVALGGLIQDKRNHTKSGIPFLQDIPVLGHLFGQTANNDSRTELMVLITPHVVDNLDKARAITDELRHKMPSVQPLFERGP
jgi:general secretion pathway protein D